MNQKHDDQNKQADQTSSILDDDLQTEKSQQNSAKLRRDDEMSPE